MSLEDDRSFAERQLRRHAYHRIGRDDALLDRARIALRGVVEIASLAQSSSDPDAGRAVIIAEMFGAWCSANGIPPGLTRWTMESVEAGHWRHIPGTAACIGGAPTDTSSRIPVDVTVGICTDRWSGDYGLRSVVFGLTASASEIGQAATRRRPLAKSSGLRFVNDPTRRKDCLRALAAFVAFQPLRTRKGCIVRSWLAEELHRRLCPRGPARPHYHESLTDKSKSKYPRPPAGEDWCNDHPVATLRDFVTKDPEALAIIACAERLVREWKLEGPPPE